MGSLYSKLSGAGDGGKTETQQQQQQQQQHIDPKHTISHDPDSSPADLTAHDVTLGLEVKVVNGESDDSHLVTSSSSPDHLHHHNRLLPDLDDQVNEERTQDTDDTEPDDLQNASLAANGPTDETLNGSQVSASSSNCPSVDVTAGSATSPMVSANGHHGDGRPAPSKAESVATWAQVVAGMSSSGSTGVSPSDPNDTDEMESVTSDDSSSVNSNEVTRRNGAKTRQRSAAAAAAAAVASSSSGKRSSSSRHATPATSTPSKRLRGSAESTGGNGSSSGSGNNSHSNSPAKYSGPDGDRPFACRAPGCEWAFKALFHLNRHRKVVHGFNDPLTAAAYQLVQQQWLQQQQTPPQHQQQQVVLDDGPVVLHHHHPQQQQQQQDMNNFFDHVILDANSPNTY